MLRRLLTFLALTSLLPLVLHAAPAAKPAAARKIVRNWTAPDGRSMQAELLEFDSKELRLKRLSDLQILKAPVTAFGKADQEFVAGLLHERMLDSSLTEGPYAEKMTGAWVKAVSSQGLNYQIYGNPKWDNTQRYPLLIWLHGSGQSGTDNQAQMGGATGIFTSTAAQEKNPCIMIAPQCPDAAIGWNKDVAQHLMALIGDIASKLPVDTTRIYLTGSSMGGFGAWRLAAEHPEIFAAVVPLCGGGDPKKAEVLKTVPIWAFHGDKDEMVPVERTRVVVKAIQEAGGERCKYTELTGEGHGITGIVYPKPELHEWLFAQHRPRPE